jgi:hypothetical protein
LKARSFSYGFLTDSVQGKMILARDTSKSKNAKARQSISLLIKSIESCGQKANGT